MMTNDLRQVTHACEEGVGAMDTFSALVGQIYDTIVFPGSWPGVLTNLVDYIGAARSILILEDALDTSKSMFYVSVEDPEWVRSYIDTYLMLNPMRLALAGQVEPGAVILTSDFVTPEEYARSRFASEFLSQRDLVDLSVAVLESTATTISVLSFGRSSAQGFADETVRHKLQLLGPHVRRAVGIGRVLNRETLEASTLSDTLDKLQGAVFLLDRQGTILHANRSARLLLSERADRFPAPGGRLWPPDAETRANLATALEKASLGDAALGSDGIALNFGQDGGASWVGSVMSLVEGSRRSVGAPYRAVAALFIREVGLGMPISATALTSLYGLTRREIAVAAGIAEHGGIAGTAAVLGVGVETVRTHLRSIFRKTGTSRQAELVRLLMRAATPFGS